MDGVAKCFRNGSFVSRNWFQDVAILELSFLRCFTFLSFEIIFSRVILCHVSFVSRSKAEKSLGYF